MEYYTQNALLRRGWTLRLLREFLPKNPDELTSAFYGGNPARLWRRDHINEIEASPTFQRERAITDRVHARKRNHH